MVVNEMVYRLNVGIILSNEKGGLFWARRKGIDAWQFPQGGIDEDETPLEAMYRELEEEIGLQPENVSLLGSTKQWLRYKIPKQYIRYGHKPLVMGQKQKWFLLRLAVGEENIRLDLGESPEFDQWRWVEYWYPPHEVIFFKRKVYCQALKELEPLLLV